MKNAKKLLLVLVAVICVCTIVFAACGNKWPASYDLKGTITLSLGGSDQKIDADLVLNEDHTLKMTFSAYAGAVMVGEWDGTWEQNKDGTVTITFSKADPDNGHEMISASLDDRETDLGGMGGLTVTTEINSDNINSVKILIMIDLSGWSQQMDCTLTQVVEAAPAE